MIKHIFTVKMFAARNDTKHHIACRFGITQVDMTDAAAILRRVYQRGTMAQERVHILDDIVEDRRRKLTAQTVHDVVTMARVIAHHDLAVTVASDRDHRLVAIAVNIL